MSTENGMDAFTPDAGVVREEWALCYPVLFLAINEDAVVVCILLAKERHTTFCLE